MPCPNAWCIIFFHPLSTTRHTTLDEVQIFWLDLQNILFYFISYSETGSIGTEEFLFAKQVY